MTFKVIKTLGELDNCVKLSKFTRLIVVSIKRFSQEVLRNTLKSIYSNFTKVVLYPSKTELKLKDIKEGVFKGEESVFLTNKEAIQVSDINTFYNVSKKKDNDATNKIRERILETIVDVPLTFLEDEEYGAQWNEVKEKWCNIFETSILHIERKAGRKYNYDFLCTLENGKKIKVEFKYNCNNVTKLPQILSLSTSTDIMSESYAEYYYDNYLSRVISLMGVETKIKKPDYLRTIHTINHNSHSMYQSMRENEDNNKEEVDELVNESISNFLKENKDNLNYDNLAGRLEKALDKIYVMWDVDSRNFFTEDMKDDLSLLECKGIKNKNTLVVEGKYYNYMLLLRWRNHKGIMNPAWQISINKK